MKQKPKLNCTDQFSVDGQGTSVAKAVATLIHSYSVIEDI